MKHPAKPITALDPPVGPVFFLEKSLIDQAIAASQASPRRRMMLPIQRSSSNPVQRLLNVMQPGSYVRPHHHPRPQAVELIQVLQGSVRLWIFDGVGNVTSVRTLRAGHAAEGLADLEPGVWHTFTALEENSIVLEVKGGPYDPALDKVFAPWAPEESDPSAAAYLSGLLSAAS